MADHLSKMAGRVAGRVARLGRVLANPAKVASMDAALGVLCGLSAMGAKLPRRRARRTAKSKAVPTGAMPVVVPEQIVQQDWVVRDEMDAAVKRVQLAYRALALEHLALEVAVNEYQAAGVRGQDQLVALRWTAQKAAANVVAELNAVAAAADLLMVGCAMSGDHQATDLARHLGARSRQATAAASAASAAATEGWVYAARRAAEELASWARAAKAFAEVAELRVAALRAGVVTAPAIAAASPPSSQRSTTEDPNQLDLPGSVDLEEERDQDWEEEEEEIRQGP